MAASSYSPPIENISPLPDQSSRYVGKMILTDMLFIFGCFSFYVYFSMLPSLPWLSGSRKDIENENVVQDDGDEVRPPLPVIREALYDDAMLYGFVSLLSSFSILIGRLPYNFKHDW